MATNIVSCKVVFSDYYAKRFPDHCPAGMTHRFVKELKSDIDARTYAWELRKAYTRLGETKDGRAIFDNSLVKSVEVRPADRIERVEYLRKQLSE